MNRLDSRTWLIWGVCCMVPLLVARHPVLVLELMVIVIAVRMVCTPPASIRWGWIVRISIVFATVGVVFNALTVRSGNQVAFHLPLLGWTITWNAIAYGVVSGVAIVALVLTGITAAAGLDWVALTRVLPTRLAPLAVSGSVAWSFLPAASQAFAEIHEAQAARGHQIRGGRDVLPIVVPLLDTSLGRALTMSETLEARGFGAAAVNASDRSSHSVHFRALFIVSLLLVAYAISLGVYLLMFSAAILAIVGFVGLLRTPSTVSHKSRYQEQRLNSADYWVTIISVSSLITFLILAASGLQSITFNPYPNLELPVVDYRIVLALALLLVPAFFPYQKVRP